MNLADTVTPDHIQAHRVAMSAAEKSAWNIQIDLLERDAKVSDSRGH